MKETYLIKQAYSYKETRGVIITDSKRSIITAMHTMQKHRGKLEKYIHYNPLFLHSLSPVTIKGGPVVVEKMAKASEEANVGPMAAVAGVLADLTVDSMIRSGAKVAVVEDGGEASAISNIPIDVALSAGNNFLSRQIGFRLQHFPIGIATSSGKFSHSLSLGDAEAATIFADNAGLADAAATAVCNVVRGQSESQAIKKGIRVAMSIKGVMGVFIIYGKKVGRSGKIPTIIEIKDK